MRLDLAVLDDLAVTFLPRGYLRVIPLRFRSTPLGMGIGRSRFSSPDDRFKLLYIAEDLATGVAETLIRDRFEGRRRRRLFEAEAGHWGVTEIVPIIPLKLIDLRTTGLLRLGVSTDAGHAKSQHRGRALSAAIHASADADGIFYRSRLTSAPCCAVYERGVGKLVAGSVKEILALRDFVPALRSLGVELLP